MHQIYYTGRRLGGKQGDEGHQMRLGELSDHMRARPQRSESYKARLSACNEF